MGTQQSTLSRERQQKVQEKKADITKDYMNSYEKFKNSPSYLNQLLTQNPLFAQNLVKFFPQARQSYVNYVEMVGYLRKYEPSITSNPKAKKNITHTALLDRFLMICAGIQTFEEYQAKQMNQKELQNIFNNYMKLFIKDPESGYIQKLLKFIHLDGQSNISLKKFALEIREYLPHAQKHLRDYYTAKFRDCQKNSYLLKYFDSKILREDAVLLSMKFQQIVGKEIVQLYDSQTGGLAFHSIERKLLGYTGHWLLLVEHSEKNLDNEKVIYKFGTYQSGPIREASTFQGSLDACMFSIEPKIRFMSTQKGEGGRQYFYINNIEEKVSKRRRGFGFGGDKNKQNFKLWIDQDLDRSSVFNGNDPTFGFGTLASSGTNVLNIRRLEVWGLGSQFDVKEQIEYWKERQEQIMKRRKVNKKQLVDGNVGMIFQKTFAHREQVVGQIEKREEEK